MAEQSEQPLLCERQGPVVHLILNRPQVHNAFDDNLLKLLSTTLDELENDPSARVIVLSGKGKSFCAGADLNWMLKGATFTQEENEADAQAFAQLLHRIDRFSKPLVARVHRIALGGATGLIACCDIVVAEPDTKFAFSEVRLGILPAVISPFVIRRIGPSHARRLMLTGERFDATTAARLGLVHEVASAESIGEVVNTIVGDLLKSAPGAQANIKTLIDQVAFQRPHDVSAYTAKAISAARASAEGVEGMGAFLQKKKPNWYATPE